MLFYTSALFVSLLQVVVAQTPLGFTPVVNQTLSVAYGNNTVTPGKLFPRAGKMIDQKQRSEVVKDFKLTVPSLRARSCTNYQNKCVLTDRTGYYLPPRS